MTHGDKFVDWLPIGKSVFRTHDEHIPDFPRYRTTYGTLELYRNNELIHSLWDNRTLGQTDGRDRIVSDEQFFDDDWICFVRQLPVVGFNNQCKLVRVVKVIQMNQKWITTSLRIIHIRWIPLILMLKVHYHLWYVQTLLFFRCPIDSFFFFFSIDILSKTWILSISYRNRRFSL